MSVIFFAFYFSIYPFLKNILAKWLYIFVCIWYILDTKCKNRYTNCKNIYDHFAKYFYKRDINLLIPQNSAILLRSPGQNLEVPV